MSDALAVGEAGLCSGNTTYRREKHVVFSDNCCKVSQCVPPIWGFVLSQLRIVEQEMYIRKNLQNSDSSVHRVLDASL